jgi:hypothetical protein
MNHPRRWPASSRRQSDRQVQRQFVAIKQPLLPDQFIQPLLLLPSEGRCGQIADHRCPSLFYCWAARQQATLSDVDARRRRARVI